MAIAEVLRDRGADLPVDQLAETIDALMDAAATAEACADACLGEEDIDLIRCVRANLDAADIATATARVIGRAGDSGSPWIEQLRVAMEAFAACAEECERHADHHDHCRACAEACRRGEQAAHALLDVVTS